MQQPTSRMSKPRLIKNLGVISLSFVLLFTGYDGLSFLQSTMNEEKAVGVIAQAAIYLTFCISTILVSKYVIQKIGCKYSIVASQVCYVPYIASNFYPRWATMVPTAVLLGAAASILWGAQSVYFNKVSAIYCSVGKKKKSVEKNGNLSPTDERPPPRKSHDALVSSYSSREQIVTVSHGVSLGADNPNLHTMGNKNDCVLEREVNFGKSGEKDDLDEDGSNNNKIINSLEVANALFFGAHFFLFNSAQIWSNLMSYYVLKIGMEEVTTDLPCSCGANFCNADIQCIKDNLRVPNESRYLLSGLCVGCMVLGIVLLVIILEPIEENEESVAFSLEMLSATIKNLKKKNQIFLAPLPLLIGTLEGFYTVDLTRDYIGCAWGTYNIGLVTIYYGIFSAISASISGCFVKCTGRVPVVSFGVASTIATCVLLLLWTPGSASQSLVFYVIASLFGISIGVLWSQIIAFYGVIFREDGETAFAGFLTWNSFGWVLMFALSNCLCTYIKIYAMVFLSFIALLGYLMTERSLLN